jgi:hypothetical protein
MVWRIAHILIAVVVVLATVMPVRAPAMPMASSGNPPSRCANCPPSDRGSAHPGKMTGCQILVCVGAVATVPSPAPLPTRTVLPAAYTAARPLRWAVLTRAPDPFPPKPIALV